MNSKGQDPVYYQSNPELVSVCHLTSFNTADGQPPTSDYLALYENAEVQALCVVNMEDGQEEVESGSNSSSGTQRPLTGCLANGKAREVQENGVNTTAKVASIASKLSSKTPSLPNATNFDRPWRGIEHHLREQSRDTDPETLDRKAKPLHTRTWFACTIYAFMLLTLLGAIIAVACDRSFITPNKLLKGEIVPESDLLLPDSNTQFSTTTPEDTADEPFLLDANEQPEDIEPVTVTLPPIVSLLLSEGLSTSSPATTSEPILAPATEEPSWMLSDNWLQTS